MMIIKLKRATQFIFLLVFALILIKPVYAVGIYFPNDNEIDFKPGLEKTFNFAITPSRMDVKLSVSGYLSEYITLTKTLVKSESTDRAFKVMVKLPEKIEKPGHHKVWIAAKEVIDESKIGGNVGTSCDAMVYILVHVLNPGKYVEMSLSAPDVEINEPVNFAVRVKSFGEQDINSIKAAIDVYSPDNEKLATVYTGEKSLKSNTEETLHAQLDTKGYQAGTYKAIATLNYDGKTKEDKKSFRIGELNIKIINYTKEFEKNKINKFDIEIESEWGNKIEDVYGEIKINNDIIKTPSTGLAPWEKKIITAYWNTNNVETGFYDAEMTICYNDKITVEIGSINVIEKKEALVEKPGVISLSTTTILILIIILLIIIDIIWMIKKRKSEKKQKEKKNQIRIKKKKKTKESKKLNQRKRRKK